MKKLAFTIAMVLLATFCLTSTIVYGQNTAPSRISAASTAPKPAPNRLRRPTSPPAQSQQQNPSEESTTGSAGVTSVSLTGGVTRLDAGSAFAGGVQKAAPLSGNVATMIQTPLVERAPQSEQIPPALFRAWLEKSHPEFCLNVSQNAEESVIVLKGQWDDSAKTLRKFQIPHMRVGAGKVAHMNLDNTRVVIVDCAGEMGRESRQKLRDFVIRGGYLLSTDWALDNFTGPTFNEYIQWNKAMNRRDIYDATVCDADPVLFGHTVTNAAWKLDQDSHLIRVLNKDAVRILVKSQQLTGDDPDRQGILAVMFPFGRGYVLHMSGHFDNNSKMPIGNFLPDPAPTIKISLRQALATNFIVAGLTNTRIPTRHQR